MPSSNVEDDAMSIDSDGPALVPLPFPKFIQRKETVTVRVVDEAYETTTRVEEVAVEESVTPPSLLLEHRRKTKPDYPESRATSPPSSRATSVATSRATSRAESRAASRYAPHGAGPRTAPRGGDRGAPASDTVPRNAQPGLMAFGFTPNRGFVPGHNAAAGPSRLSTGRTMKSAIYIPSDAEEASMKMDVDVQPSAK
ncbi:hypothetical protein BDN70DRAFT_937900 [Pholiota conissans]|uniref:Uncharacterized protein n=1 Tax=Pholiota conissans TaxID=109636 RepID=A0A9P5YN39_9AGAR|nr:hypothetical protein BDN70DRAFT_937900 [Pholiota conissans]